MAEEEFISADERATPKQVKRDRIRHILIGKPEVVRRTIDKLHVLEYAERHQWSAFQSPGRLGELGEVLSIMIRYPVFE